MTSNSVGPLRIGLTAILALLYFQCSAASAETSAAALDHRIKLAISLLEQKADADSLAAAGLMRFAEGKRALDLLVRATTRAPERADLAWLQIQICRRVSSCDSEPEEARLRALDPSNGVGWLNALARAHAAKNETAQLAVLTALARTERVEVYWTTLIVHLTDAIAATHEVQPSDVVAEVIGVLAAQAIPAYQTILSLCKDRLGDAEVVKDCRTAALAFERGDTDITEMVGVSIAQRVWPADSTEWARASQARRVHDYRFALLRHSAFSSLADARWAAKYLALCAQNRREQDLEVAMLIDEGENPDPPPGWTMSETQPAN